jgi:hypothetical protein
MEQSSSEQENNWNDDCGGRKCHEIAHSAGVSNGPRHSTWEIMGEALDVDRGSPAPFDWQTNTCTHRLQLVEGPPPRTECETRPPMSIHNDVIRDRPSSLEAE